MAKLRDDCFAAAPRAMSVEEAVALLTERVPVLAGVETVPLSQSDGRVTAEAVPALHDVPPFDNAAVDGYAVRFADLAVEGETVLPLGGRIKAGASADGLAASATALRILTGAPMPEAADTIFMQEDVTVDAQGVRLPPGIARGANRRPRGEDIRAGEIALPAGRRLRPPDLALAAASGHGSLRVRQRVRLALFSTGDELTEPGDPLRAGAIHDANRVMLAALLRRLGAQVSDLGILRDDPASLRERLRAAAKEHDLVVTSGGVSAGEEDHVKAAAEASGRLVFWRLAIKPGRPIAMGLIAGTPFVGLPGNPVSAYVTLLVVLRPLLARLGGETVEPALPYRVRAAFDHAKKSGRREYLRVALARAADGTVEARRMQRDGAAMLTALSRSEGLVELGEDVTGIAAGDLVDCHPHALLW